MIPGRERIAGVWIVAERRDCLIWRTILESADELRSEPDRIEIDWARSSVLSRK